MPRGGKRKGTGRPKASGKSQEPTKTVRVPISFAERIPELLKKHQEENSLEDLLLPAKVHEEYLPLERLAWDAFEAFCFDFIARFLKSQEIYHYGTQGDTQEGMDIIAHLNNGEKWGFQCKQWQKFNRSDATKVLDQAKGFEADRYILLLSRVASVEVRKVIADNPKWAVWDVRDISQRVRELPIEVARRLVRAHFHPEWQNAFLGISKITPFVSSDDFFHSWLDAHQIFNHTWKLEGRDNALKSLHRFVSPNEKQRVAILSGRGGIGKTKLLYEFSKTFEHNDILLWFIGKNESITSENADSLPLQPCVIVVDDAHQRDEKEMKALLGLVCNRIRDQHPGIKLVLSSRPYAVQMLQTQLTDGGISSSKVHELKEMSRIEMKALARQALGQDYAHFSNQLAAIAYDSPLVTVVGGRLLASQAIPLSLLERNQTFQDEVLTRFQEILIGQVSLKINPECCKKILELMAAVAPVRLKDEQFQEKATEFLEIDKKELIKSIGILEKSGVILRRGDKLRITPDVLAEHILNSACLTEQGYSTGYAQEVFEAFREIYPTQVLRNLAELDWRIQRSDTEQEINLLDSILQNLKEEFKQASNWDRCRLLSLIKEIAYYQPEFSLDIVQLAIRNPPRQTEDENIGVFYHSTLSYVLSELPGVLQEISYTLDYMPICCDLLWQIGRDDPSRPYNNPPESIKILIELAKYSNKKPLKFNWNVLNAIKRWLQEPDVHNHIYSPLDILDPFFSKEIEDTTYNGENIFVKWSLVDHKRTQEIRKEALKIIDSLVKLNDTKISLRVLKSLRGAFEKLYARTDHHIEIIKKANQGWESEQVKILGIVHSLVTSNVEPLVQLKAIEQFNWCARHCSSSTVQQKTKHIIDSIPLTDQLKITGALINNYAWYQQLDEFDYDWKKQEQAIEQINEGLVKQFLQNYPFPHQSIQFLNKRLEVLSQSDENISTKFFRSLAKLNPTYAIELCEKILEMGDCPLAKYMDSILCPARESDPEKSAKVFQAAINSDIPSFCQSMAKIYWAWEPHISPDIFNRLVQKLLSYPHLEVRKSAVSSLASLILIQSHPQLAISLALDTEIDENRDLAEELFMALDTLPLENLTEDELQIFLCKLDKVHSLDNQYHIGIFLVHAIKRFPYLVFQLILKRIEINVTKDQLNYTSIPSCCLHYLSNSNEYENILREIRNLWFEQEYKVLQVHQDSNTKFYDYTELYTKASLSFIEESKLDISPTSLKLLNEWINSGNIELIKAASNLMTELHSSGSLMIEFHGEFIFRHLEFFINLLVQAYEAGDNCYELVSCNLFKIAVSGVRIGIPGQPFSEDIKLRDNATEIAKQFPKGSPTHRFFESLAKHAKSNIDAERLRYEENWE